MQYIVPILLQLGYFTTPIFYDVASMPERARFILGFNPMLQLLGAHRRVLIYGEWPAWGPLAAVLAGSLLALWLTYGFFRRASLRFLEEI